MCFMHKWSTIPTCIQALQRKIKTQYNITPLCYDVYVNITDPSVYRKAINDSKLICIYSKISKSFIYSKKLVLTSLTIAPVKNIERIKCLSL